MSGPTVAAIATAAAYGALAGAALGGISAAIQGGDIGMGILGGGLGGAITGGVGAGIGGIAGGMVGGAMGGVVNSAVTGGDPMSGALMGGIMGGVSGALSPSTSAMGGMGATLDAPQSLATGISDGSANALGNSAMESSTIPMGAEMAQQGPMMNGSTLDTVAPPVYQGQGIPAQGSVDMQPLGMTSDMKMPITDIGTAQDVGQAIDILRSSPLGPNDPQFMRLPPEIQGAAINQYQSNSSSLGMYRPTTEPLGAVTNSGPGIPQANAGGSQGYIDSMNIPNDPLNPAQRLQVTANNKLGDIGMGPATATTQLTGYNPQTAYTGALDANGMLKPTGGIPGATAAAAPWGTTGIGPVDTGLNWIQNNKLLAAGGGLTLFSALGGNSNQAPAAADPTGTMNPSFNKPLQQYGYLQPGGAVTQYRQVAARPTWVPQTQTWGYNAQGQMVPVTSNGSGGLQQMKAGGAVHGGQDDRIPILGAAGEYMVPADVVSGLGDGYSDAGAKKLDQLVANVRQHKGAPKKLPKRSKPTAAGYLRSA